jgi:UPF0755 protein
MSKKPNRVLTWLLVLPLVLGIIASAGAFAWFELQSRPVATTNTETVIVVVRRGQSLRAIADTLYEKGLIRHPLAFLYTLKRHNLNQKIQAGTYKLSPQMNTLTIAQNMMHGTLDVWVTLVEGWRREEMASAIAAALETKGVSFNQSKFLELTKDKEGYLFPDSYLIPLSTSEADVASLLERTFKKKVVEGLAQDISQFNRPLSDVIIMASLIEREARTDKSRQMVSGILWKRLDNSWPLQVDASVQYTFGYDKNLKTWWREPLGRDLAIESPYNTYKNPKLPPTPICSPSLSSIKAALNPMPSDYWFYISDRQGNMHYAATNADHEANITKYLR